MSYPSPYPNMNGTTIGHIPKFTTKTVKELRKKTKIGDVIKFTAEIYDANIGHFKTKEIRGFVEEKYTNIFKLSDGHYYQWKDYMLGFIY